MGYRRGDLRGRKRGAEGEGRPVQGAACAGTADTGAGIALRLLRLPDFSRRLAALVRGSGCRLAKKACPSFALFGPR